MSISDEDLITALRTVRETNSYLSETNARMFEASCRSTHRVVKLTIQVLYLMRLLDENGIAIDIDTLERYADEKMLGEPPEDQTVPARKRPELKVVN
jgi:hypothetical protein